MPAARRSSRARRRPDGKLTVEFAECLGICDFAPAALADDGRVFGPLEEETVDAMIEELKTGRQDPESRRHDTLLRPRRERDTDAKPIEEIESAVAAFEPVLSRNWNVPDSHTLKVYESRGAIRPPARH